MTTGIPGEALTSRPVRLDLRSITHDLEVKGIRLSIGGLIHDQTDQTGKLLFGMFFPDGRIRIR